MHACVCVFRISIETRECVCVCHVQLTYILIYTRKVFTGVAFLCVGIAMAMASNIYTYTHICVCVCICIHTKKNMHTYIQV